jgi:uncharacterized protein
MKKFLLFITLIAALALAACATPPAQESDVAAPQQQSVTQQQVGTLARTISVSGTGQVTLTPEIAYVYIGVQSSQSIASDALKDNNEKSQALASALGEMGVDPKDIQTSSFNIYPQQAYNPDGTQGAVTYNVNNTVYVTVRNLQTLGQLLDVVVRSGANSINGITFDVADKTAALSEARKLAVDSARKQAEEMAANAGVELGDLQTLNVYTSSVPMPVYEGKGGYASDASQVPVSAGQLIIKVDVGASYFIK